MIRVEDVTDRAGLETAWRIRHAVFVVEQHVPIEEEVDHLDTDPSTHHVLVWRDDAAVGTGRVLAGPPGEVHVGRVAVVRSARARGIGAVLMAHLEGIALAHHAVRDGDRLEVRVVLSAQEQAMGFYTRLGYEVVSGRYLDAGIWHRDMERRIRV